MNLDKSWGITSWKNEKLIILGKLMTIEYFGFLKFKYPNRKTLKSICK